MNEQLHPLTLGEILDQTAHLYRSRFLVFFGIGVVPAGTVLVFAAAFFAFVAWIGSDGANGASIQEVAIAWTFLIVGELLAVPACLGATALGSAAMSHAAARAFLGEKVTIRDAYKSVWKSGWRYVGLYVFKSLIVVAAPAVAAFVLTIALTVVTALLGGRLGAGANTLLGAAVFAMFIMLVVCAVWMLLLLSLGFPASVIEQTGIGNALKRSVVLTKGTRGRILLLYLLGMALGQLLALGLMIPAIFALALIPGLNGPAHTETLGSVILFVSYGCSFAVQAFTKPVFGIGLTIFYFDQRIRKEGFDIEWMMQRAGMVPAQPVEPQSAPWLPPVESGHLVANVGYTAAGPETDSAETPAGAIEPGAPIEPGATLPAETSTDNSPAPPRPGASA